MVRAKIGPGPGKYLLPPLVGYKDHDPSKYRNPQYSMGLQLEMKRKDVSPGPKYHTEHMTSYGKAHPPAYSLAFRNRELTAFQGPGPAAYDVRNVPRMKEQRPPAYSMSYRHDLRRSYEVPAPNVYDVPTTLGPKVPDKHSNGAYSMSHRYQLLSKEKSPGPAKYDPTSPNVYKHKLPVYTLSAKHNIIRDKNPSPAPSTYYPKLGSGIGYSFGLKTDNSPYITPEDDMPCINK